MKKSLVFATVFLFASQAQATTQELIDSVKNDNLPAVLNLLEHGEDVNAANEQGNTALHYAVAKDNAAITQALLLYGADINASNEKGWTPMKIAEKKELKNVNSLLENAANRLNENRVKSENTVEEMSNDIRERAQRVIAAIKEKNGEIDAVKETVEAVNSEEVPNPENIQVVSVQVSEGSDNATFEENKQKIIEEQNELVKAAENEVNEAKRVVDETVDTNARLETEKKSLEDEVNKLRAENAELSEKLKEAENKVAEVKSEVSAKPAEKQIAKPVNKVAAKPAVKKPVAKKPVAKKPIAKKAVLKPSSLISTIYEGDEEIVYCLSYLGHGENQNMGKAAGYFASSAQIKESRYLQIADMADLFFNQASGEELQKRNTECGKIITPKVADKQNQIIRSLNQSVGY